MKWLIASDLHGSAYWCRKLMEAFERENADRLLLLGDLLYHGPRNDLPMEYDPKAVIAMLNDKKQHIFCVRGNCDTEVDQMVLEFPILADYTLLPVGDKMVFATHGHHFNKAAWPPLGEGDVLLHGHTHVSLCEKTEKGVLMNPGSVSIPKEDTPHGYMTLEDTTFTWKTMDGTVYNRFQL